MHPGRQDSVVGIVTRLQAARWGCLELRQGKEIFHFSRRLYLLFAYPASNSIGAGSSAPGGKAAET
jgi:hypothetical protein